MQTIEFTTRLNPEYPVFGIVVPYPGTGIYTMARHGEQGYRLITTSWSDYNKIIGKAIELEGLSRKKLEILQLYGYASVLLKNARILDSIRFIFQFRTDIKSCIENFFHNFRSKN